MYVCVHICTKQKQYAQNAENKFNNTQYVRKIHKPHNKLNRKMGKDVDTITPEICFKE